MIINNLQFKTQNLAVVADFLTIEEAQNFFTNFEESFSFASICSCTFRPYPKFEYAYWFDWLLVIEDIEVGRSKIRNCFGNGWTQSGDDEVWNAENRQELSVPVWAMLSQPHSIDVNEAHQLNLQPQVERGSTFISVSTKGQITGSYPSNKTIE